MAYADIPNFPGYRATDSGTIESKRRDGTYKPLKPDVDSRGRSRVTLCLEGKTFRFFVSNLVLRAFKGSAPHGTECCHNNGDHSDNRLENLRWDTHSANMLDKNQHGTAVCGERINTAKLTEHDVREIRRIGGPLRPLAAKFGVTETMISFILRRKNWKHVS